MRANYAACYSSNHVIASLSGWNGLFYSFFCAVRKIALWLEWTVLLFFLALRKMALVCRNARNLSTSGDISAC